MKIFYLVAATILFFSIQLRADDLPDSARVVFSKFEEFEQREQEKFDEAIRTKRNEVQKFLVSLAEDESKKGNENGATAIIAELKKRGVDGAGGALPAINASEPTKEDMGFGDWLQTVVLETADGKQAWWIDGKTMSIDTDTGIPGVNKGGTVTEIHEKRRKVLFKRGVADTEGMIIEIKHNLEEGQVMFMNGQVTAYLVVKPRKK